MKSFLTALLVVAVLLFGGLLIKIVWFPVNTVEKSIDTAYGVVDKTMTTDNAIYNYEWFKEQEANIRVCLKNEEIAKSEYDTYVATLPKDRNAWSRDDKQEEASLRNSYIALQKLTNIEIEKYNARASMVNRNVFKDNLPSNMTRAWYAGQNLTK